MTTLTALDTLIWHAQIVDPSPAAPTGGFGDKINTLLSWLMWGCIIGSVAGVMICGASLGYQKITGGGGDATSKLVGGLIGAVIIGSAAGLVNGLVL